MVSLPRRGPSGTLGEFFLTVPLLGALAIAGFTGLRMPNLWATTLYSVSVADGVIRRSVFGTVLLPIFAVFGLCSGGRRSQRLRSLVVSASLEQSAKTITRP